MYSGQRKRGNAPLFCTSRSKDNSISFKLRHAKQIAFRLTFTIILATIWQSFKFVRPPDTKIKIPEFEDHILPSPFPTTLCRRPFELKLRLPKFPKLETTFYIITIQIIFESCYKIWAFFNIVTVVIIKPVVHYIWSSVGKRCFKVTVDVAYTINSKIKIEGRRERTNRNQIIECC